MPPKKRGRPKKVKPIIEAVEYVVPKSYFISLAFGGEVYEGSGATVLEALKSMPRPVKIVSKGLLKLTDGVKKFEQMWMPVRLKRLFYPQAQGVLAKQLTYLLK